MSALSLVPVGMRAMTVMTAEIVNLRMARKRRDRAGKESASAENRARFGQTKAERTREEAERARRQRELDGAQRVCDSTSDDVASGQGPEGGG